MNADTLYTPDLELRSLKDSDYEVWRSGYEQALPSQSPFDASQVSPALLSRAHFVQILQEDAAAWQRQTALNWYAFSRADGALIGGGQLWDVKRGDCQRAVLGFWVLNQHWRKGLGTQIGQAILTYGFQHVGLHRIEAEILVDNAPSATLCKKLGMQFEGIKRGALRVDGDFRDHALYAMLADDPRYDP